MRKEKEMVSWDQKQRTWQHQMDRRDRKKLHLPTLLHALAILIFWPSRTYSDEMARLAAVQADIGRYPSAFQHGRACFVLAAWAQGLRLQEEPGLVVQLQRHSIGETS